MTDPIADMLTRIRNAQAVHKPEVVVPYSKFKQQLAELLVREGWLAGVETAQSSKGNFSELLVKLKYTKSGRPAMLKLARVSTPGRRVYAGATHLPYVLNGLGIAVVSTSAGLMTNHEARKKGVGGEVICEIY